MRCILTVNYSPWSRYSGGGQRSTHNLASALARRGHQVSVIFTKVPWERVPVPSGLPYEVVWAAQPGVRRGSPLFVAAQLRRMAEAAPHGSDVVVHGNGEEAALVPDVRRGRAVRAFGFVMTPRYPNFPDVLLREPSERSLLRLATMSVVQTKFVWLARALRQADWVCPTSRSAANMVQRAYGLDPARMSVVHNGISNEFLHHLERPSDLPDDAALRGFVAGGEFAVYFGRIAREKGVHTLLDALVSEPRLTTRVVFAGRGPELPRLRARVQEASLQDRVLFTTWLDAAQLASLVRRASFAVLPSLEESFGNTMAEALALSVPVISTTAGSIPEVIEADLSGILVPPSDAAALAAAMLQLQGDPARRRALGEAGRAHVAQNLSWDASAARFERIYEQVLGASNGSR